MIIERLDLIAFGRFTNFSLDLSAGPRRFHIVHGPNESGKSTSLRAISDWLFGFQGALVDDYVHASRNLRVGGRLSDPESEHALECIRRRGNKDTLLAADNKTKISAAPLEAMLQGIDKDTFRRQFGISHQQLVEGGNLILAGKGDLSEILFSAGAGLGRLQQIRQKLAEHCKAIYTDRKSSSPRLHQLLEEWEVLQATFREQVLLPATYESKRAELARASAQAASSAASLVEARKKLEKLQSIQQAASAFLERRRLLEKLAPLKDATQLAAGFTEKRRELQSQLAVADQQVKSLETASQSLQKQLDGIRLDEVWLSHEATIERLSRNITQYEQNVVAIGEHKLKLVQVRERLAELTRSLGAIDDIESLECNTLTASTRAELVSLANQYSGVLQLVASAEEKLHSAKTTARKLKAELKAAPRPASPALLDDAIRLIGPPQPLVAAQSRAMAQVEVAREQATTKLHQLIGFTGTLEQAVALPLPPRSTLAASLSAMETARQSLQAIETTVRQSIESREQVLRRIEEQSTESTLPDAAHCESLLDARNQLLDGLLDAASQEKAFPVKSAVALRDHTHELDRIHALRHQHHDQVLRREQDERLLQKLDAQLAQQRMEQDQRQRSLQAAIDQWKGLWKSIGVEAGDVEEMRSWCLIHQQLVEAACELNQRCCELQLANDAVDQAAVTLRSAIQASLARLEPSTLTATASGGSTLFDAFDDDRETETIDWPSDTQCITTLHAFASRLSRDLDARFQSYESLAARCEATTKDLELSQTNADAANRRLKAWEDCWETAVEPLQSLGKVTPDSIDRLLKSVEEIARLRRDAIAVETALHELGVAQTKFCDSVQAVVKTCAPHWLEGDAVADEVSLVTRMVDVVKTQREDKRRRDTLAEQLAQSQATAVEFMDQSKQVCSQLAQLCQEANCKSIDQLAECENRSAERRELLDKIDAVEATLSVLARGVSLADFEAESVQYDAATLDSEIQLTLSEIESGESEQAETQQAVGQLTAEMKKMDGSGRAAELLQQQQNLLAKIRREAEDYAKLSIAQDVLARAIEKYRRDNEGTVLAKAGQYFSCMTCQQYESLQVEFDNDDKPQLFAIKTDSRTPVPADRLSDGTADALYLAMRLASLDVHLHANQPIPLIIDDCLIQFDDQRASAVLDILCELSLRTQVIMFTHHDHVVELASARLAKDHFHLHQLTD
ncbi:MAG: AAA family ATPase [Planctomycetaceae bacterium]